MEGKKSLNKLWREMGKPVPFKDFAKFYNNEVVSFYKSATGEDTTSTKPSSAPTIVKTDYTTTVIAVGVLIVGAIALYSLSKSKQ